MGDGGPHESEGGTAQTLSCSSQPPRVGLLSRASPLTQPLLATAWKGQQAGEGWGPSTGQPEGWDWQHPNFCPSGAFLLPADHTGSTSSLAQANQREGRPCSHPGPPRALLAPTLLAASPYGQLWVGAQAQDLPGFRSQVQPCWLSSFRNYSIFLGLQLLICKMRETTGPAHLAGLP